MGFNSDLPTIQEQIQNSEFTQSSHSLSDFQEFDFTLAHIPDPPKVEVKKNHLIEAINKVELDSILININNKTQKVTLFYVTKEDVTSYQTSHEDGIPAIVSLLLCEDWFTIEMNKNAVPTAIAEFFEEMKVLTDGYAEQGELFSETYAANQLKNRIYDLKQTESDMFLHPEKETQQES